MSICSAGYALLRRDLALAWRSRAEIINPLLFFSLVVLLFPLGLGTRIGLLQTLAPAIIWIAVILATILSMDSLFRADFEDGTLEQLLLTGYPLSFFILTKLFAHWLCTQAPIILIAPLFALFLKIPVHAITTLIQTLLIGTPVLSVIGAIGVTLTLGFRRGGMLLSILLVPLYVPVLIFACAAVELAADGLSAAAQIDFLLAMLCLAIAAGPVPTAAAIKMSIN